MRMRPLLPIALCAAFLALPAQSGMSAPFHQANARSARVTFEAEPVATGLNVPAAFTFAPSGRVWYGEKDTGEIHVLNPGTHVDRLFFDIPDVPDTTGTERGLLGLALHPDFPDTPYVYAFVTRKIGDTVKNQIVRLTARNGRGTDMRVLFWYTLNERTTHNGGHIAFGPGGFLYAFVGDNHQEENAQDTANVRGKMLRLTDTGAPAPGNPFNNRVWSYGNRNSFGFDFDTQTGRLWETENGPQCTDELNHIVKGGNYAWGPSQNCTLPRPQGTNSDGPTPRRMPKAWYSTTIAPTGMAFCQDCGLGSVTNGSFLFGDCNNGQIHRVTLNDARFEIASQAVVFTNDMCVMSMETDPHGAIYFSDPEGIFRLALP